MLAKTLSLNYIPSQVPLTFDYFSPAWCAYCTKWLLTKPTSLFHFLLLNRCCAPPISTPIPSSPLGTPALFLSGADREGHPFLTADTKKRRDHFLFFFFLSTYYEGLCLQLSNKNHIMLLPRSEGVSEACEVRVHL